MDRISMAVVGGLFLAVGALSQTTYVIPKGMERVEGGTYSYTPAGRGPSRTQFIYAKKVMPGKEILIKACQLRRDGLFTTAYAAHAFDTEIWMSNNPTDPAAGYSGVFAGNRGADFTQVMLKRSVSYPALSKPANAPAAFSQKFILDKPFRYQNGAFLVEFVITCPTYTTSLWYPDAATCSWSGLPQGGKRVYSGKGCPEKFFSYGVKPHIGQELYHYGYSRVNKKKLAALDLLGTSKTGFGPLSLPFDLAGLGAPGCNLYTDVLLVLPGTTVETSSTGYVRFDWGFIPNVAALVGAGYFEQQLVFDPGANPLGLRLSRLAQCTVGDGLTGMAEFIGVFGYGKNYSLGAGAGTKVEPIGLIMELET